MSKRRSSISKHRSYTTYKTYFFTLCALLFALGAASCAPRLAEKPSYTGVPLEEALANLRDIASIEAVLSVEYAKNDSTMTGDAFLNLSENRLNLRLYYLGFLAGEVSEENGVIKSNPKLSKYKSMTLVDGLKNSFFWWNLGEYTMQEKGDVYVLKNYNRKVLVSKETLLPVHQTIELDDGEELDISYDAPAKQAPAKTDEASAPAAAKSGPESWYQSSLAIRFRNHLVRVKVKSYSVAKLKG